MEENENNHINSIAALKNKLKNQIKKLEEDFEIEKSELVNSYETQISEIKTKMNKTYEFNRNYLITKYTKEIEDLKFDNGKFINHRKDHIIYQKKK